MRRRRLIFIGAGMVLVAGVLVAWLAVERSGPKEPVYQGVPLSKWLDGKAKGRRYLSEDLMAAVSSIGPEAIPWMINELQVKRCGTSEVMLYRLRFRLNSRWTFLNRFLPDPLGSRNGTLRLNIIMHLSRLAPGTHYERDAVRAILRSREIGVFAWHFESLQLEAIGRFTNCQNLVFPALLAGVAKPATTQASLRGLRNLGPSATTALYRLALAEPGTNGPAEAALAQLDINAWARMFVEKRGR